ncbi:hypothetical protein HYQ44_008355 [Verticillium longisporum]|nr:hypothetical protein HYQ44_008355 [Verticillium longisporum]
MEYHAAYGPGAMSYPGIAPPPMITTGLPGNTHVDLHEPDLDPNIIYLGPCNQKHWEIRHNKRPYCDHYQNGRCHAYQHCKFLHVDFGQDPGGQVVSRSYGQTLTHRLPCRKLDAQGRHTTDLNCGLHMWLPSSILEGDTWISLCYPDGTPNPRGMEIVHRYRPDYIAGPQPLATSPQYWDNRIAGNHYLPPLPFAPGPPFYNLPPPVVEESDETEQGLVSLDHNKPLSPIQRSPPLDSDGTSAAQTTDSMAFCLYNSSSADCTSDMDEDHQPKTVRASTDPEIPLPLARSSPSAPTFSWVAQTTDDEATASLAKASITSRTLNDEDFPALPAVGSVKPQKKDKPSTASRGSSESIRCKSTTHTRNEFDLEHDMIFFVLALILQLRGGGKGSV